MESRPYLPAGWTVDRTGKARLPGEARKMTVSPVLSGNGPRQYTPGTRF